MSDMSFKQAKELAEQLEFAEITLSKTVKQINQASKNFENSLIKQENILKYVPQSDDRLNIMKIIVAVNIGFIIGLVVSKYLF
jgi:hypothetical protein